MRAMKFIALIFAILPLPIFAEVVTVDGRTCDLQRDRYGRIARSKKAVSIFRKSVPCPGTGETGHACPGYVVDHVIPLCACGADDPSRVNASKRVTL